MKIQLYKNLIVSQKAMRILSRLYKNLDFKLPTTRFAKATARRANYQLPTSSQSGVAVILAVLLIGIILSIVLTLSLIFAPKIKSAADVKGSVAAIYAAESAIEWCLYVNRINPAAALPVMSNGATFVNGYTDATFVPADCVASPLKAVGAYQGVTRSFEISF